MTGPAIEAVQTTDLNRATVLTGRVAIELAENELPGLLALRAAYDRTRPLSGKHILACLSVTADHAVLVETLAAWGADVRWVGRAAGPQDVTAAVVVGPGGTIDEPSGLPVSAWSDPGTPRYWGDIEQAMTWPDGSGPDSLVDEDGDASLLIHLGVQLESAGVAPAADADRDPIIHRFLADREQHRPGQYFRLVESIGASASTAGLTRLKEFSNEATLLYSAIDVGGSVGRGRFDTGSGSDRSVVSNHAIAQLELHRPGGRTFSINDCPVVTSLPRHLDARVLTGSGFGAILPAETRGTS